MDKRLHIAVVYNEPLSSLDSARQVVSPSGSLEYNSESAAHAVDLSELEVMEAVDAVEESLASLGYNVTVISASRDISKLIQELKSANPDLVFNQCEAIENNASHEMAIAGIYELLNLPYTGSTPLTLGTALNKVRTKEILSHHGLPTPKYQVFKNINTVTLAEGLRFPLIVKPTLEDASIGICNNSVVNDVAELKRKVRNIYHEFDEPVLVEEYVDGRELNVAILGNKKPVVLPISEIDFSGMPEHLNRIVSYEAKWIRGSDEYIGTKGVCPAGLQIGVESKIKKIALRAYQLMGCRDYARVDIRLDKNNMPCILEVNPNPDISKDSGFVRSTTTSGMSYDQLIGRIVDLALERQS
jgi:D-alanine-D-alanine ligase